MSDQEPVERRRDTSAKRKSILEAAMRVFIDDGYENATMDRIAEVAVASKRTVYNHFSCKEELLRAVIERFEDAMRALKSIQYDPHRTVEEQLAEFVDAEVSVVNDPTWLGLIHVLLSVFKRYPEVVKRSMSKYAVSESGLSSWMRAAMADRKLEAGDHATASRLFSSMLGGAITWPAVYQGASFQAPSPELKREIVRTFLARYGKSPGA